jgi:hypothetical protein
LFDGESNAFMSKALKVIKVLREAGISSIEEFDLFLGRELPGKDE